MFVVRNASVSLLCLYYISVCLFVCLFVCFHLFCCHDAASSWGRGCTGGKEHRRQKRGRVSAALLAIPSYHTIVYHTIPYWNIPYRTIPYHIPSFHTILGRNHILFPNTSLNALSIVRQHTISYNCEVTKSDCTLVTKNSDKKNNGKGSEESSLHHWGLGRLLSLPTYYINSSIPSTTFKFRSKSKSENLTHIHMLAKFTVNICLEYRVISYICIQYKSFDDLDPPPKKNVRKES